MRISIDDDDIVIAVSSDSSPEPLHDDQTSETETEEGETSDELRTPEVNENDGEREENGVEEKRSFA